MSNFKVGDRVVCVNDYIPTGINSLKNGRTYIVQDIKMCSCGCNLLDVGAIAVYESPVNISCLVCTRIVTRRCVSCSFFSASRFRKVIEQPRVIRIEVERTEPVLN